MFFKRRKHPLPRFPHTVIPTFKQLSTAIPPEQALALIGQVDECVAHLKIQPRHKRKIDLHMAEELGEACKYLLQIYPERNDKERAMIMGAVRYFAFAEDPFSERDFATGFDDDARVVNHVLEYLKIEDRYIVVSV